MKNLVSQESIEGKIYIIRGFKVMIDRDLAELYQVPTRQLKRQVRRNIKRFPAEFMFKLTNDELKNWRCHFGTSNYGEKMGLRHNPYAFTEHGIAMLSGVLKSKRAIEVNIQIIKAFIKYRQMLWNSKEIWHKIESMEKNYDGQFKIVFDALKKLLLTPEKFPVVKGFIK